MLLVVMVFFRHRVSQNASFHQRGLLYFHRRIWKAVFATILGGLKFQNIGNGYREIGMPRKCIVQTAMVGSKTAASVEATFAHGMDAIAPVFEWIAHRCGLCVRTKVRDNFMIVYNRCIKAAHRSRALCRIRWTRFWVGNFIAHVFQILRGSRNGRCRRGGGG